MNENKRLEEICKRLVDVPVTEWREEKSRIYTEINEVRFYISSRISSEIDYQDKVLVGEGESSEIVDLVLPVEQRYVKLEVLDTTTNRVIEAYERRDDIPFSLYKTMTEKIEQQRRNQELQRKEAEVTSGRKKLGAILGIT